uniref:Uncharacterized protein n=1 Tax=Rhizophora mucronata TaxID=61149 RepID=A0A2P2QFU0_RHIMU
MNKISMYELYSGNIPLSNKIALKCNTHMAFANFKEQDQMT